MIVGVQPQRFLRYQFERQQQLRPICQQQFHVAALEFGDNVTKKLLDPRTSFMHRILGIQALFLPSLAIAFLAAATSTGPAVLLKNHCWASPTILPVSQYNTSPLDKDQKKNRYMSGINCIIFCWLGSPAAGGGVMRCSA